MAAKSKKDAKPTAKTERIDMGLPPTPKRGRPKKVVHKCVSCGTEYVRLNTNFMQSSSELFAGNEGYIPICKGCLERYYTKKVLPALDNDERRAVEVMCAICDWYYNDDAINTAIRSRDNRNKKDIVLCSLYGSIRGLRQVQKYGSTYVDTVMQRRIASSHITEMEEADGDLFDPDANHVTIDPAIIHVFGLGYRPDEYQFLAEQYDDWINRYECNTKALEECIKALCVAQLNIRRSQQAGDSKATADAMKAFQSLLDTSNLSPKKSKEDQIAQVETFGTLIRKWEEERPIPEPSPEFADVDGITKLVRTWFFGHLCKMFNIKNDYTAEYEAEVAKYSVTPPDYTDIDTGDSQEIDSIFGNAKRAADDEEDGGDE